MDDHINDLRQHAEHLCTLLESDDDDIAGDAFAELAELSREANSDPSLWAALYPDVEF